MTDYAIIVAGGKGLRMGTDLPKQFLPVGGRPVLMRTLEAFERAIPGINLILVLPTAHQDLWRGLCQQHHFTLSHTIADGGATRFYSVRNGLLEIAKRMGRDVEMSSVVGVHDGVRPFVSPDVIRACYAAARQSGAAIPVVPVVETVRQLTDVPADDVSIGSPADGTHTGNPADGTLTASSVTIDRSRLRLVQTPQAFRLSLLLAAYEQPYCEAFTDDASVVEALGQPVQLVEGNRENIKITTPFDLVVAEALVRE